MPGDPKALLAKLQPKVGKPFNIDQQLCKVRFSPDGSLLAGGSFVGTIRRWTNGGSTWKDLPAIEGHSGWVTSIGFRGDGKQLYSADSWGKLAAHSAADEKPLRVWEVSDAHTSWIHGLAVRSDDSVIATVARDGKLRLTDPKDGKAIRVVDAGMEVMAVTFHPKGPWVVTGDARGVVSQWEIESGKKVRELDAKVMYSLDRIQDVGGVRCFTWNSDASLLIAGGCKPKGGGFVEGRGQWIAFDWATGKQKYAYQGTAETEGFILDLAWHRDGFLTGVSSGQPGQGKLFFHQVEDALPFYTSTGMANCHSLSIHPDGKQVVVSATNANSSGNGRPKGKDYPGNFSPLFRVDLAG